MRCLIVNPSYRPATGAVTERVVDLAEHFAAAGHEVQVLCWKHEADARATEVINGVTVSRIGNAAPHGLTLIWGLARAALSGRFDADVVLTIAPPMPLAWFGWLHSFARSGRSKHVVWVMDLETERTSDVKRPWSSRIRGWSKRLLFAPMRRAALVVSIGRCMGSRLMANGIAPDRIKVVPLWSNRSHIEPTAREASLFAGDPELRDKFVVMYSGRAARYHEVETVCEAMRLLRDAPDIAFVFAATDVGAAHVGQYAAAHKLPNYYRRQNVALKDLGAFLAGGDAHLVTLKDEMLGSCVPSKTYGVFAAARPVLFVGPQECEAALNVKEHSAGRVVRSGNAEELARQIRAWRERNVSYRNACDAALRAFETRHCAEVGCAEMLKRVLQFYAPGTADEPAGARRHAARSRAPARVG